MVEKGATIVEDCLSRTIKDADASTRKHIRRYGVKYCYCNNVGG